MDYQFSKPIPIQTQTKTISFDPPLMLSVQRLRWTKGRYRIFLLHYKYALSCFGGRMLNPM